MKWAIVSQTLSVSDKDLFYDLTKIIFGAYLNKGESRYMD